MIIDVPKYDGNSFKLMWENGFFINCSIEDNEVHIEANKEGLISLARHLLELAQDSVPEFTHFHLDEFNSLEDNSSDLVFIKKLR